MRARATATIALVAALAGLSGYVALTTHARDVAVMYSTSEQMLAHRTAQIATTLVPTSASARSGIPSGTLAPTVVALLAFLWISASILGVAPSIALVRPAHRRRAPPLPVA